MPMFKVNVGVGHPDGGNLFPVDAVVDTESAHSVLPASLLADLNVSPLQELGFILADGSRVRYGFGIARFEIDGKERPCPVVFGPGDKYLLGKTALGIFNLKVDHGKECLLPQETLSLSWGGNPGSSKSTGQSILEMFDELHRSAPEGAFDALPTDGARNYKHYLYGFTKDED